MIYIYDIVLNFQEQLYDFYEWNKKDRLLNIKKIPIFRINTEKLLSIINDKVYLKEEILHKIAHETTIYMLSNNEYKYLCLFSNTEETVAVMCNEEGLIIKKSSLLFDEEDEANEVAENLNIDCVIEKTVKVNNNNLLDNCRIIREKKKKVYDFIKKLDLLVDKEKIRYLYFDLFEEENLAISKMKELLLNIQDEKGIDQLFSLYDLVENKKKKNSVY